MPTCRESTGQYKKCKRGEKKESMKGLTPKQKANLPVALQKAILAKRKK